MLSRRERMMAVRYLVSPERARMRRRTFIATAVGSIAGWASAVPAETTDRTRLVGLLNVLVSDDPEAQVRLAIFQEALQRQGWAIGRDVRIEARQVGGDSDLLRKAAAELVALAPDVILSIGSLSVGTLQQATTIIPIVFVNAPDPVGAGFVQSMAHPGGNITGFSNFEYSMSGKWARVAQADRAPHARARWSSAIPLRRPASGSSAPCRSVAQSLGIELTAVDVRDARRNRAPRSTSLRALANGGIIVTRRRHRWLIAS